jgi:PilZ domain
MRARRFPLHLAARYRPVGDGEWQRATTENISASGVLFHVDVPVQVDTRVEFRLLLPPKGAGEPAEVLCRGRVVRIAWPAEGNHGGFAVEIDEYDFLPLFSSPAQ